MWLCSVFFPVCDTQERQVILWLWCDLATECQLQSLLTSWLVHSLQCFHCSLQQHEATEAMTKRGTGNTAWQNSKSGGFVLQLAQPSVSQLGFKAAELKATLSW